VPRLPTVVAAAVATTLLVVVLASGGSAQQPGERTLMFTERNNLSTFKLVDNPPRNREGVSESRFRLSLGDMLVGGSPLFDAANERRVGRVAGTCTVIKRGSFDTAGFHCATGFRLREGTIEAQGFSGFGRTAVRFAVVGGTGAYEGARGTFAGRASGRTSTDVIHLLP
jgi:Dirigent-like protein